MLPCLAQAKLSAPTAEGRRLRRRLLRGTVAVIIVAGYEGKRFIYERAKELGIRYCANLDLSSIGLQNFRSPTRSSDISSRINGMRGKQWLLGCECKHLCFHVTCMLLLWVYSSAS